MNSLISEYIRLAAIHGDFVQSGDDKKANETHSTIRSLVQRIEIADPDIKKEFYNLLSHPNSSVRLWTAIELLGTAEQNSKTVIKKIKNEKAIIGLTAKSVLEMWEKGLFKKGDWEKKAHNNI